MALKCPWCRSTDLGAGFDGYQCFSCGGFCHMDGSPTVPTSALETEQAVLLDGIPGQALIDDPDNPPHRAKDAKR